jgi:hypothetical protein
MYKFRAALVGLLCLTAVVGCTTNNTIANTNFTTHVTDKLAVGTMNDTAGTMQAQSQTSVPGPYTDVISVFRNQLGNSPFLHPGNATMTPGLGTNNIGNTGFGIGLFAYGQNFSLNGLAAAGPAWAAPGSGTGFLIDLFGGGPNGDLPPLAAGGTTFTVTDTVQVNGTTNTYSASAALNGTPTILTTPAIAAYAPAAGTGGGTFTFGAYPAGATEQVAVVLAGAAPNTVLAMAEVCTAGCANTGLTAALPAGTLAAGAYTCFVIATDFPWVEAGVTNAPAPGNPNPTIVGANGNADMSVGAQYACTQT